MTWRPETDQKVSEVDLTSTISSATSTDKSGLRNKFKSSSGKTYGNLDWDVAPLVYPGLDDLATQTGDEAVRKRDKLKKAKGFVEEYMDKRAQAKFVSFLSLLSFKLFLLMSLVYIEWQAPGYRSGARPEAEI
jgi:hypothetical protein